MEATSTTATARMRSVALDYAAVAAFLFGAVLVGWVAADDGGWWPETWAWTAFATLAVSIFVAFLLDRPLGRLDLAFLGGLVGLGTWTAISAWWSPSVPSTLDEAYRVLAYVGTALLALLVIERRTVPHVLGGVLTAIATLGTYALATRLLPDRIGEFNSSAGGYRLSEPVTYWNGLALFLVVGILLALGFAARGRALWTRALAAATLPVLTSALYFTFSRGAWIALILGVAAAVVVDARRLQFLAVSLAIAPFSVAAVWLATRADGLRTVGSTLAQATEDGHALLGPVLALAAGSALVALGVAIAERRLDVPGVVRVTFVAALLVALVALGSAAWAKWGSPVEIADRAWEDFRSPPNPTGTDLGARFFDFSSSGRVEQWRVAWDGWREHPAAGAGAGTYWQMWAAARPNSGEVRDAHSLYLETLAELGVVGLALLIVALLGTGYRRCPCADDPDRARCARRKRGLAGARRDRLGLGAPRRHTGSARRRRGARRRRQAGEGASGGAALVRGRERRAARGARPCRCAGLRAARIRPRRARRLAARAGGARRAIVRAVSHPGRRRHGSSSVTSRRSAATGPQHGTPIARPSSATARAGSSGSRSPRYRPGTSSASRSRVPPSSIRALTTIR